MGGLQEDGCDLTCRGLTFVPPDGAFRLLGRGSNIAEAIKILLPLLSSRSPPYGEALVWLQPAYNGYWMGAYVAPASQTSSGPC